MVGLHSATKQDGFPRPAAHMTCVPDSAVVVGRDGQGQRPHERSGEGSMARLIMSWLTMFTISEAIASGGR